jgi:hypothetical protein
MLREMLECGATVEDLLKWFEVEDEEVTIE